MHFFDISLYSFPHTQFLWHSAQPRVDNLAFEVVLSIKNMVVPCVPMSIPVEHYFFTSRRGSRNRTTEHTHTPGYRTKGLIMKTPAPCFPRAMFCCFVLALFYMKLMAILDFFCGTRTSLICVLHLHKNESIWKLFFCFWWTAWLLTPQSTLCHKTVKEFCKTL